MVGFVWFISELPDNMNEDLELKGTRCLASDELVNKKRLKPFVMKCIWLERCFKSRI